MQLSRFIGQPAAPHLSAAKRLLRYLKGTMDLPLRYNKDTTFTLKGFADASYPCIPDNGRSVSGYIFTLSGTAISWLSKVQPIVAVSTTEAEYIAPAHAAKEAVYLGDFLKEPGFNQRHTVTIYKDNMGALHLASNVSFSSRTKHIQVRYHFPRTHQ
ncbi:unnamed protein product [Discosporangium mesarthrocarpum]